MTCKECINFDVCSTRVKGLETEAIDCEFFKDKSRFVELPSGALILTKEELAALNKYQKDLNERK